MNEPEPESLSSASDLEKNEQFTLSCQEGDLEAVIESLTVKKCDINFINEDGFCGLYLAVQENRREILRYLIAKGVDLDLKNDTDGGTALHIAAEDGMVEIVTKLLEAKAEPNPKRNDDATPLFMASQSGHVDCVRLLLNASADSSIPLSEKNVTCLRMACLNGHFEVVTLLLESSADPNVVDGEGGFTPVYVASQDGYGPIVSALVDAKADLTIANIVDGGLALHIAAEGGHLEVVDILINAKAEVNAPRLDCQATSVYLAAQGGHAVCVQRLVEAGADVNLPLDDRSTPLGIASSRGHLEVVKFLIANDADLETIDKYGSTAIGMAANALSDNADVIRELVSAKARVDIADVDGYTPLHLAALRGSIESIKALVYEGRASLSVLDLTGQRPADLATPGEVLELIREMEEMGADEDIPIK